MSQPLPPLNALRAFEAIARHLSFAKAAEELHVTPAALSHQIRALEEQLGLPLFHRRTRAIELTDAGRLIYPGLHAGFESVRGAIGAARTRPIGQHPGHLGDDRADRQMADAAAVALPARASGHRRAHLGQHEACGLHRRRRRRGDPAEQGEASRTCMWKSCSTTRCCRCAARAWSSRGCKSPADLARFPLIHYDIPTSMRAPPRWADWFAIAGVQAIDATRGLHVNVADHALDAAVAGAGVSLSFKLIASDDVHFGRLVTPFGPELPLASSYNFVCPKGHETRPKVRAFRDWLFAEMEETQGEVGAERESGTRPNDTQAARDEFAGAVSQARLARPRAACRTARPIRSACRSCATGSSSTSIGRSRSSSARTAPGNRRCSKASRRSPATTRPAAARGTGRSIIRARSR